MEGVFTLNILKYDFDDYLNNFVLFMAAHSDVSNLIHDIYLTKASTYDLALEKNELIVMNDTVKNAPINVIQNYLKFGGIVAYGIQMKDLTNVNRIVKKASPKIYKLFTTKTNITVSDFEFVFKNSDDMSYEEGLYQERLLSLIIGYLLSYCNEVSRLEPTYAYLVYGYLIEVGNSIHSSNEKNEQLQQTVKTKLSTFFSIATPEVTTLASFLDDLKDTYYEIYPEDINSNPFAFFNVLMRAYNIDGFYLHELLHPKQLVLIGSLLSKYDGDVTSKTILSAASAYILGLIAEYERVKAIAVQSLNLHAVSHIEEPSVNSEEIDRLNNENNRLKHELAIANSRIEACMVEEKTMRIQSSRLSKDILDMQDKIQFLEEHIDLLLVQINTEDEDSKDEDLNLDILKEFSISIVGGHESWIADMKQYLPNAIYIDSNKVRHNAKSLNPINSSDIVVFNQLFTGHGQYHSFMKTINDKQKIVFIDKRSKTVRKGLPRIIAKAQELKNKKAALSII